jgi:hypothetical protein
MKNFFFIFLTYLISTQISAQIITGGGGPDSPYNENSRIKDMDPIDRHIINFTSHLIEKDSKCTNGERLIKDSDLMQVYLKLSLFKNTKSSTVQCDEVNRYLMCLNDEDSRKYSWRLERMMGIEKHIAKKYNISTDEAKNLLKFFSDLGKKVE